MRLFEGTKFDRPPTCSACGKLEKDCGCPPWVKAGVGPEKQTAKVVVEKRPKGRTATVVRGLNPEHSDLAGLLSQLKSACGTGGVMGEHGPELQGDQADRVRTFLTGKGYKVK
jgi:translation initiation factor 1